MPSLLSADAGNMVFLNFRTFPAFLIFYGIPEAPEPSKNLPGARGVIFPKYEPMTIHLDPFQVEKHRFCAFL